MAIKNKKTSLKEQSVENRLREKLKESYNNFLKEEDEDLDLSDEDIDSDEDLDFGSDEFGGDEGGEDAGLEDDFSDELENPEEEELTPSQEEFFDDQIDLLLEPNVEQPELEETEEFLGEAEGDNDEFAEDSFDFEDEDGFGDEEDVDIESDSDDLDGFNDSLEDEMSDDSAIDDEELQAIIDAPNTYEMLGDVLRDEAIDAFPSDEELSDDIDSEVELEDELDEAWDLYDQTGNHDQVGSMKRVVNEANKNTKQTTMKKAQPAKKQKVAAKNASLKEEIKLTPELKQLDFDEEDSDLESSYDKVSKPEGKEGKVEHGKGLTQNMKAQEMKKESIEKSKMLVKAAKHINNLAKKVKELQLENYRLIKANGILSAAADKLDKESRKKISESFDKCNSTKQVDQLYGQIVNTIKQKSRPSLNESVNKVKSSVTTTNILKEGKEEKLSLAQQRKNLLMGLSTEDDVYMNF